MPLELSGSIFISGSMTVSGSFGYTGSFNPSSGSLTFLPYLSGSFTTASISTGSVNQPFLYVINGVLWFYNGVSWNQLFP
jgi:hypothetical protein